MADAAPSRLIAARELGAHKDNTAGFWMAIHGRVYDVTRFLFEHPGGDAVMIENAGTDATERFEEVGHSPSAKNQMGKFCIGTYEGGAPAKKAIAAGAGATSESAKAATSSRTFNAMLPFVFILGVVGVCLLFTQVFLGDKPMPKTEL